MSLAETRSTTGPAQRNQKGLPVMLEETAKNAHSHRKRRYWLVAAAATAPALILAMTGVAHAGTHAGTHAAATNPPPPNCPDATLCTYQNTHFNMNGGTQWNYPYSRSPHLTWFYVGPNVNDKISSLWNNRAWLSYVAKNCPADDQTLAIAPGEQIETLVGWTWPDGTSMNDQISAVALGTSELTQGLTHGSC